MAVMLGGAMGGDRRADHADTHWVSQPGIAAALLLQGLVHDALQRRLEPQAPDSLRPMDPRQPGVEPCAKEGFLGAGGCLREQLLPPPVNVSLDLFRTHFTNLLGWAAAT